MVVTIAMKIFFAIFQKTILRLAIGGVEYRLVPHLKEIHVRIGRGRLQRHGQLVQTHSTFWTGVRSGCEAISHFAETSFDNEPEVGWFVIRKFAFRQLVQLFLISTK